MVLSRKLFVLALIALVVVTIPADAGKPRKKDDASTSRTPSGGVQPLTNAQKLDRMSSLYAQCSYQISIEEKLAKLDEVLAILADYDAFGAKKYKEKMYPKIYELKYSYEQRLKK
ncbi:uncharacterized protein LOC116336649 [Contarinia nasturtii]|uniref:uncharacterized protein LOC116336649 n=1 Tax=Contarinia nasturtii TaxID=265458 RepID=UPI0012D3B120|nr:uncharacterized protein LOC116336649 [Contarinia nasturtii]